MVEYMEKGNSKDRQHRTRRARQTPMIRTGDTDLAGGRNVQVFTYVTKRNQEISQLAVYIEKRNSKDRQYRKRIT